jgi:hypothetical protein
VTAFLDLPADERRELCEAAQTQLGLAASSIEKDWWVSFTLRELFALPGIGASLTFKGGTSLSKGWQLVQRFSEDIDIVVDRAALGFGEGDFNRKRLDKLRAACSAFVAGGLRDALHARLAAVLRSTDAAAGWSLTLAPVDIDADRQTLLFVYPTAFAATGRYVAPVVRIELGARSETEPAEQPVIADLLSAALPDVLEPVTAAVRTVAPRRTFLEKAMLLHEEQQRPADKPRKRGLSRHYYDLWSLREHGVAAQALADAALFDSVVAHRRVFFRISWVDYATMAKGRIKLVPDDDALRGWRQDYAAMRSEMFYAEPPSFEAVMRAAAAIEAAINGTGTAG